MVLLTTEVRLCPATCLGTHRSELRWQPLANVLRVHDGIRDQVCHAAGASDGQDDLPVWPAHLRRSSRGCRQMSKLATGTLCRTWDPLQGLHTERQKQVC